MNKKELYALVSRRCLGGSFANRLSRAEFVEWCDEMKNTGNFTLYGPHANELVSQDFYQQYTNLWFNELTTHVRSFIVGNNRCSIKIIDALPPGVTHILDIPKSSKEARIENFNIEAIASIGSLTLRNLWIRRLRVVLREGLELSLENCHIADLWLDQTNTPSAGALQITNSNIGRLRLQKTCVHDLKMNGGMILGITCPKPGAADSNPFLGSVSFNNVLFPRCLLAGYVADAQPYRNMRYHMHQLENGPMTDLFHCLELLLDEQTDTRETNKFFSQLYRLVSNYGSSTLRPIIIVACLTAMATALIWYSDGAILAKSDHKAYTGASKALVDGTSLLSAEAVRTLYLASQPIVNPIGIFGGKYDLVKPSSVSMTILVWIQNLLTYLCLVMFVFALRRRFKISQ